jgi:hypothetical protein
MYNPQLPFARSDCLQLKRAQEQYHIHVNDYDVKCDNVDLTIVYIYLVFSGGSVLW